MKITLVAGARPNFMKIAPIIHAIKKSNAAHNSGIEYRLIHTGQHYDQKLSQYFFDDLNIPHPDANLEVGSGSHAVQTAKIMIAFEQELLANPCDYLLVVGDVNSTLACTLVAKKMGITVIHVEAGLRSYDLSMPEEINRMATDAIADIFFTTTPEAGYKLTKMGCDTDRIYFVGNVMIDSLINNLQRLQQPSVWKDLNLKGGDYYLMTLHRPSNVDEEKNLQQLIALLGEQAADKPILFPAHPRTQKQLQAIGLPDNVHMVEPMRYLEFIYMVKNAFAVLTDSGGIQEETTYLGVPCFTLRENTERPETITVGTNELIGTNPDHIIKAFKILKSGNWKKGKIPLLWDGHASNRIVEELLGM
ncbi:non-hydrolyzing UDP-N-acetylglucosamine 2-epimerase [Aureispira sp. CCB-QB1]|uniref:non-hydrolyzing UDP-N-acetylglucosamine 2-epimerase n=1 Tax=Aureispira sp. CCB-QB1 TaxID=1313421 RepID=UPI000697FEF0|nr:UDP-N-acetylglucosamine 2-epimerase (non-hydrolyzing) [Aureispira sp. CCB-QB1]